MFRFSMRELFLVTLITAIGLAWWIDRQRLLQPPVEYFGKPETLPLFRANSGKNLPYRFGAVQASGKPGSLSSNLE